MFFLDSIKKSLDHSQHTNDGQEVYFDKNNQVMAGPSTPFAPLSTYCPNASFDFLNFTNWTGTKGTVISGAVGASSTIYSAIVPGIFNAAGINVSIVNTTNYHTIMTTPPTARTTTTTNNSTNNTNNNSIDPNNKLTTTK